jgi:hypothetical protein
MRTTLILDADLVARAQALSGIREKTGVLHEGLRALIARESARRLAALGGFDAAPRRRRGGGRQPRCWSTRRSGSTISRAEHGPEQPSTRAGWRRIRS